MAINKGALKLCKYYKGEKESPFELSDNRSVYWSMEEGWVKLVVDDETRSDNYVFAFLLDFEGGLDHISIPVSLKAFIYDQYSHFGGSKGDFVDFLLGYLGGAS